MITGFSLSEFGERDRIAFHIEPGFVAHFQQKGSNAWLLAAMSEEQAAKTMRDIEMATGIRGELEGFTLFHNPGKGWQMSTRRKGETGWSIQQGLADEQVRPIFNLLEPMDHPDNPLRLKAANGANAELFSGLTAAILARIGL